MGAVPGVLTFKLSLMPTHAQNNYIINQIWLAHSCFLSKHTQNYPYINLVTNKVRFLRYSVGVKENANLVTFETVVTRMGVIIVKARSLLTG